MCPTAYFYINLYGGIGLDSYEFSILKFEFLRDLKLNSYKRNRMAIIRI